MYDSVLFPITCVSSASPCVRLSSRVPALLNDVLIVWIWCVWRTASTETQRLWVLEKSCVREPCKVLFNKACRYGGGERVKLDHYVTDSHWWCHLIQTGSPAGSFVCLFWIKPLHAVFSVCNHRQVTNVSGFLCRWRRRPRMTATRRPAGVRHAQTQSPPATHPTPCRPIIHSIVTGRMIAAGVSVVFTPSVCVVFPHSAAGFALSQLPSVSVSASVSVLMQCMMGARCVLI